VEVRFYFDYRSPFAYLAKDLVYGLEDHYPPDVVHVQWLPFAFPVEEGFGLPGASSPYVLSFSFFTSSSQRSPPTTRVTSSFTAQGRAAATTSTRSSTPTSTHGGKNHRNQHCVVCVCVA
jgi:2-hydroxychromene-2-carboxylate isomerase